MRVAVPTTPASYFHLLRRQALSPKKKPLVVFTPKSLLRHRLVLSPVADFTSGTFAPVLGDPTPLDPRAVRRVLLCTGKVFYDLYAAREERKITDIALVRMEQLYPLPVEQIRAELARYPNASDVVWVQEEPANQCAWTFIAMNLVAELPNVRIRKVSRPEAAAPAGGSTKVHDAEQAALIDAALSS
jgi:2-oxoglutarate dehydrogenase E1 component